MKLFCNNCEQLKEELEFNICNNTGKRGRQYKCRECEKKYKRNNVNKIKQRNKIYNQKNKQKIKQQKAEYYLENREYINKRNKQWAKNNPEKIRLQKKKYFSNPINYERHKITNRKWRQKNPDNWLKIIRKTRAKNIHIKIADNLRKRVKQALKNDKMKRIKGIVNLIGCEPKFLKTYIESKWQPGMSWENYGRAKIGEKRWHMDHIMPCSKFNLTNPEQQKKCFHYTNLQPLWWQDNLKKSNK
ncbi:MAG: hypothetical protein AABY22_09015 [Nanoarchaeota archaeon]